MKRLFKEAEYTIYVLPGQEGVRIDWWMKANDGSWEYILTESFWNVGQAMRSVERLKARGFHCVSTKQNRAS